MVKPERRTKGDMLAAAAIVASVAVVAALVWWMSDARATLSRPASSPAPTLSPARTVPATVRQLWTAPSPRTAEPVIVADTVVTGDGQMMVGREPATGAERWSFARDRDLCGVTRIYELAVAAYPDNRGCGQISTVDAKTGKRGPTRTSFANQPITLSTDGSTVLAAGATRVELWRSDMVRTLAYGDFDAPINPPVPPNPPCEFLSSAGSSSGVSILEACPESPDIRLTFLSVSKEDVVPEVRFAQLPGLTAEAGAQVVAESDFYTAVYLPTPQPRVAVYDDTAQEVSSTPLARRASPNSTVSRAGDLVTYWTGDSVVVLDGGTLEHRYTIAADSPVPLGPGDMMANRLLIPVTGGIGVYDPATGKNERVIPVDRGDAGGPIVLGVAGPLVLEQRGDTVVALG